MLDKVLFGFTFLPLKKQKIEMTTMMMGGDTSSLMDVMFRVAGSSQGELQELMHVLTQLGIFEII